MVRYSTCFERSIFMHFTLKSRLLFDFERAAWAYACNCCCRFFLLLYTEAVGLFWNEEKMFFRFFWATLDGFA